LTREAFALYRSRLAPDGVLITHISNRHLQLAPVIGRLATSEGFTALQQLERPAPGWPESKTPSHWVVMAQTPADLGALARDPRWSPIVPSPSTPLWTDDFSNILSVLAVR
jgi:hypothetical protein